MEVPVEIKPFVLSHFFATGRGFCHIFWVSFRALLPNTHFPMSPPTFNGMSLLFGTLATAKRNGLFATLGSLVDSLKLQ